MIFGRITKSHPYKKSISLDFETYCDVDLKVTGAYRYVFDQSFDPLCLAVSIDFAEPFLWVKGDPPPYDFVQVMNDPTYVITAYNAGFERYVINRIGKSLLGLKRLPPVNRYRDTQALARFFGLPANLEKCGEALGLDVQKYKTGKDLINKLCRPKKPTKAAPWTRWTPATAPDDFENLYKYCLQDVRVEQEILKTLPHHKLSDFLQIVWQHTVIQNERGLYIDKILVEQIVKVLAEWKDKTEKELSRFTDGYITTGNQRERFIKLCKIWGYSLPDLKADTLKRVMGFEDTPDNIKNLLNYRKLLSKNSTAKFNRIGQCLNADGTVKDNLFFYGANTGRYAGRGFQMHNLPRSQADDPEKLMHAFHTGLAAVEIEFGSDVMAQASKLIRPCVHAPPGYDLIVSDYSSIENRYLHWLAQDEATINEFRKGLDQYKTFAASLFNIRYEDVTDTQRKRVKPTVLGLGYMMGVNKYIQTAEGYGVILTQEQAQADLDFYRHKYKKVVQLWYRLYDAALDAVRVGVTTKYSYIKFIPKHGRLFMRLPTGRLLCYHNPKVELQVMPWGQEKPVLTAMGVDPYTKNWERLPISPGRLTENAVQGGSWDVLANGAINAERAGYTIVGSVHDEPISIVKDGWGSVEEFSKLICQMPKELRTLPLKAEGYRAKRYRKD